jgi:hypothetical protein
MFNWIKFKSEIATIGEEFKKLQSEIESKKQMRESMGTLALPLDDFADMVCEVVDHHGDRFTENLNASLKYIYNKPKFDTYDHPISILTASHSGGGEMLKQENLMFVFKDQIKAAIRSSVDQLDDYPDTVGPPRSERPGIIKKLDKEILELEEKLSNLSKEATEAGIQLA